MSGGKHSDSVSRRELLRSTTISISSLGLMGVTTAQEQMEDYVIARSGSDCNPESVKQVPKRWADHQKTIRKAKESVSSRARNMNSVNNVAIVPSDKKIGDLAYSTLEVGVKPGSSSRDLSNVPRDIDEVIPENAKREVGKIQIQEKSQELTRGANGVGGGQVMQTSENQNHCPGNTQTPRPFHGGLRIMGPPKDNVGTSGFAVWHEDNGKMYHLTANHVVTPDECTLGGQMYDHNGDTVGVKTVIGHKNNDWTLMCGASTSWDNKNQFSTKIYTGSGTTPLSGWVTEEGVQYLSCAGSSVYNFGTVTGFDSGKVTKPVADYFSLFNCVEYINSGLQVSCQMGGGDSGGPIWYQEGGNAYIIGHNSVYYTEGPEVDCAVPSIESTYGEFTITFPFFRIEQNNPITIPNQPFSGGSC